MKTTLVHRSEFLRRAKTLCLRYSMLCVSFKLSLFLEDMSGTRNQHEIFFKKLPQREIFFGLGLFLPMTLQLYDPLGIDSIKYIHMYSILWTELPEKIHESIGPSPPSPAPKKESLIEIISIML